MVLQLTVLVTGSYFLPAVALAFATALCIVGMTVPIFHAVEPATRYTYRMSLWQIQGCLGSTCTGYGSSDFSQLFLPTSECNSFLAQYRSAEAFGVICSVAAGAFTILSIVLLFLQELITMARVIIFGQLMAALLASLCLVEFVLLLSLPTRACLTTLKVSTAFDAAAFLYIAAVGLCVLTFLCGQWLRIRTAPKPRIVPSPRRLPPPAPSGSDGRHTPSPIGRSADPTRTGAAAPSASPGRGPEDGVHMTTVVVTTDEDGAAAAAAARGGEREEPSGAYRLDAHVRPPIPRSQPPSRSHSFHQPMVALEGDDPLPEGDDWQIDEASGLLWSEEKQLFFDRGSGQFYDPETEQWFDASTNTWYQLEDR